MNSSNGNHIQVPIRFRKRINNIFSIFALITLILAAILGSQMESEKLEQIAQSMVPGESHIHLIDENNLLCSRDEDRTHRIGYITLHESNGYNGPMSMAVMVDTNGVIREIMVITHMETPSYFDKVMKHGLQETLLEKSYNDPFVNGIDYDAVSGATFTSEGIAGGVKEASVKIASTQLDLPVEKPLSPKIKFGVPEITLVFLYLMVMIGVLSASRLKKGIRWATLLVGMVVLGFWLSVPLSQGKVHVFMLGYWPQWQTNLYWYMLVFSVFGLVLINRKKWYCNWFCPFLAVQECLALVGGVNLKIGRQVQFAFSMFQRILAWLAMAAAFYYRSPVKLNYEIFGTAFNFTGSLFLFVLLGLFLIASLFIKRPYCHILCPVNAINDLLLYLRSWRTQS